MPEEIKWKEISTTVVGRVYKVSGEVWDLVKNHYWLNESDTSDEVLCLSLRTFLDMPEPALKAMLEESEMPVYEDLKYTLDKYFGNKAEISEVYFYKNW